MIMPDSYLKSLTCPVPWISVSLKALLSSQVFPLVLPQGIHSAPTVSGTVLGLGRTALSEVNESLFHLSQGV